MLSFPSASTCLLYFLVYLIVSAVYTRCFLDISDVEETNDIVGSSMTGDNA